MGHLITNTYLILTPRVALSWAYFYYARVPASINTPNAPVPVALGRPNTMFPDGVLRSSKSPCNVASPRNAIVVSYDALSSGDGFVEMPLRLKGLYPPSNVCETS